ncbi:hypothetical protein PI124_g15897 [Phytophthora idaei]|nr:hypothetical protein PI125_g17285 [Phytophthora idaei]KAG3150013.1 hypothetical protein PI126_g11718 [Phytophthora idaei]KAG3239163.1 hypothetical protein PI124_g15897 [Phytophthora idaei]
MEIFPDRAQISLLCSAFSAATEAPTKPPAAPPVPANASTPITKALLRVVLTESSEALVEPMLVSMLPCLAAIARPQVQLSVSPPLHTDVTTQRRLYGGVGFNDILAAVRPLLDSLPHLPRRVGELKAQLRSTEAEAAAAKRAVVPEMMAHETAEQLRKLSSATVESRQAKIKHLTATNVRLDALLQKTKESTARSLPSTPRFYSRIFRNGKLIFSKSTVHSAVT